MRYCENCGTKTESDVNFCPSCGHTLGNSPTQSTPEAGQSPQGNTQTFTNSTPTQQADISDAQANKTMAVLAYILFFIPLIAGAHKSSPFVKYHTNQGTVLFITSIAWNIVYRILSAILILIPIIGWLIILLLNLAGFLFLALCIMGILNVVHGDMKPLPIIGGIIIIK